MKCNFLRFADNTVQETVGQVDKCWKFSDGTRVPITFEILEDCCSDVVVGEGFLWDHNVFAMHASSINKRPSTTDTYGLAPFDWLSCSLVAKMGSWNAATGNTMKTAESGRQTAQDAEQHRRNQWSFDYDFGASADAEEQLTEMQRRTQYDADALQWRQ